MSIKTLRRAVWIFLFFLFAEGILRKWLLPSLSNPIMVVKDFFTIIIVIEGYRKGLVKSIWANLSIILGFFTFVITMLFGHQNLLVALWGCKILWFGIPMCYVLKSILTESDIAFILKATLYLTIVNAVVMIVQFVSPGAAWINRQPSGEMLKDNLLNFSAMEMAGLIRPSGIFAHTTQISLFCPLALGIIIFYLFRGKYLPCIFQIKKKIVYMALVSYIIVAVCSVSRTIIFSSFAILAMLMLVFAKHQKKNILNVFLAFLFVSIVLYNIPVVNKGVDNMISRFEIASESTGSSPLEDFYSRIVEYNIKALITPRDFKGDLPPFWGWGQGLSTQVGGRLAGVGQQSSGFSLAEWDALRIMLESGFLFGWLIIFDRMGCVLANWKRAIRERKRGNYLPICIYGAFFIGFYFYTQWGNSFQLAFSVFCGGLFMAAADKKILRG